MSNRSALSSSASTGRAASIDVSTRRGRWSSCRERSARSPVPRQRHRNRSTEVGRTMSPASTPGRPGRMAAALSGHRAVSTRAPRPETRPATPDRFPNVGNRLGRPADGCGNAAHPRTRLSDSLIPGRLGSPRAGVTGSSGILELACAAVLVVPASRRRAAIASAALFVVVFPGDVTMAVHSPAGACDLAHNPVVAWGRPPLQVPLVLWAPAVAVESRRRETGLEPPVPPVIPHSSRPDGPRAVRPSIRRPESRGPGRRRTVRAERADTRRGSRRGTTTGRGALGCRPIRLVRHRRSQLRAQADLRIGSNRAGGSPPARQSGRRARVGRVGRVGRAIHPRRARP